MFTYCCLNQLVYSVVIQTPKCENVANISKYRFPLEANTTLWLTVTAVCGCTGANWANCLITDWLSEYPTHCISKGKKYILFLESNRLVWPFLPWFNLYNALLVFLSSSAGQLMFIQIVTDDLWVLKDHFKKRNLKIWFEISEYMMCRQGSG